MSGGAHQAAFRLATQQSKSGLEVEFLDSSNLSRQYDKSLNLTRAAKSLSAKALTATQSLLTVPGNPILTTFSINQISIEFIRRLNPRIVHVHNWYNLLSTNQILQISKDFPLVVTAHDERLITGGCHYTFGCNNLMDGCTSCPAARFPRSRTEFAFKKTQQLLNDPKIGLITPSVWLRKRIGDRLFSERHQIATVPNIQDSIFYGDYCVKKPSSDLKIIFVADNPSNPTKGLNVLLASLNEVSSKTTTKISLHLVGERVKLDNQKFKIVQHGRLTSSEIRSLLIQSNLCAVPSLQENFPSVAIEAILSGTPVVGTNIGGIPEIISHGSNGFIAEPTVESFSAAIIRFMKLDSDEYEYMRYWTYKSAQDRFDAIKLSNSIMKFYNQVIENHH